jgi:hypothetical protein
MARICAVRDWYTDLYLDTDKVFRFRLGQSKVPYGWENLQSSSNRIPLDRNDGFNSAVRNERDLGLFFYWTPEPPRTFSRKCSTEGLKGSGNYGVFGIGAYNGQGGSFVEQNDNLHVVTRLTWPLFCPTASTCRDRRPSVHRQVHGPVVADLAAGRGQSGTSGRHAGNGQRGWESSTSASGERSSGIRNRWDFKPNGTWAAVRR